MLIVAAEGMQRRQRRLAAHADFNARLCLKRRVSSEGIIRGNLAKVQVDWEVTDELITGH